MRSDVAEVANAIRALAVSKDGVLYVGTPKMYRNATEVSGDMPRIMEDAIELLRSEGEIDGKVVMYDEQA